MQIAIGSKSVVSKNPACSQKAPLHRSPVAQIVRAKCFLKTVQTILEEYPFGAYTIGIIVVGQTNLVHNTLGWLGFRNSPGPSARLSTLDSGPGAGTRGRCLRLLLYSAIGHLLVELSFVDI